jgi:hypothetical protein
MHTLLCINYSVTNENLRKKNHKKLIHRILIFYSESFLGTFLAKFWIKFSFHFISLGLHIFCHDPKFHFRTWRSKTTQSESDLEFQRPLCARRNNFFSCFADFTKQGVFCLYQSEDVQSISVINRYVRINT